MKFYFRLDYPKEKIQFIFITDGSTDGTEQLIKKHDGIEVYHTQDRSGKIGAINRGMKFVKNPITIYSDANTMLNAQCIKEIVKHYDDPNIGCVAGEKRINQNNVEAANSAGEGLYWKYESFLKKMDFELFSVIGAAGELFSIRTHLHQTIDKDTLLDDFVISLQIAQKGYKIAYEPLAFATENASASIEEEMKRKIRICAGGIQSIIKLKPLLNIFKFGMLSFQYISHRVLRWTFAPLALLLIVPLNVILVLLNDDLIYQFIIFGQLMIYLLGLFGWFYAKKEIKIKVFFIPFYFIFMNVSVFFGFFRFIKGKQSVLWEKALRS